MSSPVPHNDRDREELLFRTAEREALSKQQDDFKFLADVIEAGPFNEHVLVSKARRELERRTIRERHLPPELRSDFAWLILLDLFVSEYELGPIVLSTAADRWGLARSTSARYLAALIAAQLVTRAFDEFGSGPVTVRLTELGRLRMRCILAACD